MAVFKCKMCGAQLNVAEGQTVVACDFCGTTQTVPHFDNQKKTNTFKRANDFRFQCEFDKASGVYETIIAEYPNEAEAYWGLVLCKYGIEYVNDPKTKEKIPTCHRTQFTSIFEDYDYNSAIRNADVVAKGVYKREAEAIDKIQKAILDISSKEEPFDVFICYKETDENGGRTKDSVLAQDIYRELVSAGFKVFFSRITLEHKLGSEYEPYIFAALHSSKVMLHVTTSKEHSNAVWVKNEWSRYLSIISGGERKTLIPCYSGIMASDLPRELAHLQGQDLSKIGAMQDLIYGIRKIIKPDTISRGSTSREENSGDSSNFDALIRKGYTYLKNHKIEQAQHCFENAIEETELCGSGYLGLLLCDYQFESLEELLEQADLSILDDENFHLARDFANKSCNETLDKIEKAITFNVNNEEYKTAISLVEEGNSESLVSAKEIFEKLGDFKDSKERIDKTTYLIATNMIEYAESINTISYCDDAIELLQTINGYKGAEQQINIAKAKKKDIYDNYNQFSISKLEYSLPATINVEAIQKAVNKTKENKIAFDSFNPKTPEITTAFQEIQETIFKQITGKIPEALNKTNNIDDCYLLERIIRSLNRDKDVKNVYELIDKKKQEFIAQQQFKKRKKRKRIFIFTTIFVALVGVAVASVIGVTTIQEANKKSETYNKAQNVMEQGNFEQAIEYYKSLGDYEEAKKKVQVCEGLSQIKNAIATKSESAVVNGIKSIVSAGEIVQVNYDVTNNPIIKRLAGSSSGDKTETITSINFELYKPTWNGYSFLSWSSSSVSYKDATASVSLLSNWSVNNYKIEYDLDGGKNNDKNVEVYTVETSTITLLDPTKYGYTFVGWYEGDNKITSIEKGSYKNYSLKARWEANKYKIDLDANGGTLKDKSIDVAFDQPFELPTPIRDYYGFEGWFDEDNNKWIDGTYDVTKNISLKASWKADSYTISYNLDGGTNAKNPTSYTVEDKIVFLKPNKEGYTFTGWTDKDNKPVTGLTKGSHGNVELYANWEINVYTVTFNNYDGTKLDEQQVEHGSNVTYAGETPTKPRTQQYSFTWTGWDKALTNITSDRILTAQYDGETNKYQITWKNYDDSTLKTDMVSYGDTPSYSGETPTKPSDDDYSYVFAGWDVEPFAVEDEQSYTAKFTKEAVFKYRTSGTNDAIITGVSDNTLPYYNVPKTIDGRNVVTIESLGECSNATEITIPDSVTSISKGALSGCSSLENLTLPFVGSYKGGKPQYDQVYESGLFAYIFGNVSFPNSTATNPAGYSGSDYRFYVPNNLTDVTIENHQQQVWILPYAFSNNPTIKRISLSYGVKNIDYYAFQNTKLESVSLENSSITDGLDVGAFIDCKNLTTFDFGNTITTIPVECFNNCSSLLKVIMPDSVTKVERWSFMGCASIEEMSLPSISVINYYTGYYGVFGEFFESYQYGTIPAGFKSVYQLSYSTSGHSYYSINYLIPISLKKIVVRNQTQLTYGQLMGLSLDELWLPKLEQTMSYALYTTSATKLVIGPSFYYLSTDGSACWSPTNTTVYFEGTESKWNSVTKSTEDQQDFAKTTVYFYSESSPTISGKWWHYVDGVPTIW